MTTAAPTPALPHTITVQPSGRSFDAQPGETILAAAIRAGVGLPYGCKDGACGSCKCRKLAGEVVHGAHQDKALSAEEEAAGWILTCCGVAQTPVAIESRQVTDESAYPIKKLPVRVTTLQRRSADVMQVQLQLPAADTFRYHAGQYIEFILRDGARRAYSMANAPHTQQAAPGIELHIRHMPGGRFTDHVFGAMKEKEILRIEGPFGSFYLREDSSKPIVLLASGTGFAPVKAIIEHLRHKGITRPVSFYWGGRRPADLYLDAWVREQATHMPELRYVPVPCPRTPGAAAPALCTRPCWRILPPSRATKCTPAAPPSSSIPPAAPTPPSAACRQRSSTPMRLRRRRTSIRADFLKEIGL